MTVTSNQRMLKGVAAAEQEMDSELLETVGREDRESMKEPGGKAGRRCFEALRHSP